MDGQVKSIDAEDVKMAVEWLGGKATQQDVASLLFFGKPPQGWEKDMPDEFFELPEARGLL